MLETKNENIKLSLKYNKYNMGIAPKIMPANMIKKNLVLKK